MVWAIILQVVGLDEAPEIPWANWYTVPLRLATLKGGCWGDPAAPTMVARIPFPPEAGPDPLAEQPIFMLLPGSAQVLVRGKGCGPSGVDEKM